MSQPSIEKVLELIKQKFNDRIVINNDSFFDVITTNPEDLIEILRVLKEENGFNYLANLSSVDYEDKYEIVYHVYSIPDNRKVAVKTSVPKDKPEVPSAINVWSTADWQEREVYDLMGIRFLNHPNLIRILLPYDFEGHPLQKSFKKEG